MVEIVGLSKKFKKKVAIKKVDIKLMEGVYGLLGPNGAGKSTLMRCIMNIYEPDEGMIKFDDRNNDIGYLSQNFGAFGELTAYEMLEYFCELKDISKEKIPLEIERVLKVVNLMDVINYRIKALSGGMVRRLGIAQAILGNPKLIIFDEPTVGLDPEERLRFKNIILRIREGKTIILSTHIVEDVEVICNKIIVMDKGRVRAIGTNEEIAKMAKGKVFEVTETDMVQINGEYYVVKTYERDNQIINRILSSKNINENILQETIEDGYLCLLKGI